MPAAWRSGPAAGRRREGARRSPGTAARPLAASEHGLDGRSGSAVMLKRRAADVGVRGPAAVGEVSEVFAAVVARALCCCLLKASLAGEVE